MITPAPTHELNHPGLFRDIERAQQFLSRIRGIRAVWLFGFAVTNRPMDWRSDLDFAVVGLQPGEEYAT